MASAGISAAAEEISNIIANIDFLGNGKINYSEFIAATLQTKHKITE
jgi:Ca2+-binding EF-hand superfamily protein